MEAIEVNQDLLGNLILRKSELEDKFLNMNQMKFLSRSCPF
uniref:Uncharacterized protein n=1 Tax=Meloidogyne enterolobii TaxID=390850 RepID=A0A6V7V8P2_MELEN|nr:unnamed protein product [Meloidogyne enterolobii]